MRRWLLVAAAAVALVVLGAGLVLAYDTAQARGALQRAEEQAADLRVQVSNGEVDAARGVLAQLQDSTDEAESHTDGPLWNVAARTPLIGQNFASVQTISRALQDISSDGLDPLVDIADQVGAEVFSPQDGRIDVDAVQDVSPGLQSADAALTRGWLELREIDPDGLVGPLQGPVTELQTRVDDARSTVRAGAKAARLIPDMLGGSDKRSYVLAFQNNAEIRSTGGLPGAFAILNADDGRISLGRQGAGSEFPYFADDLPIKPTQDEQRLYSILLTGFWGDTTLTPDFPRAAQIMRAMVRRELDRKTDGVISLDPVALSYILEATGPVKLSDGTSLTSDNAVKKLLNDVYLEIPENEAQDAYFADATRRVFGAVVSGKGGSQALLESLAKAAGESRILISSARRAEQRTLASTRVGGALAGDRGTTPHVGIFYNDATQAKLEYYLRKRTVVRATACTRDGAQSLTATTVLRSVAPKNARSLPRSILGTGDRGKPGYFRMIMTFYAPYGGLVTRLEIDGEEELVNRVEHDGLNLVSQTILLAPGQKMTVKASMFTGKDQREDAVFTTTPGIEATPNNVTVPSACR
ncbi:DUF4012 domain-containing protein [Aeromicrobium sp.]|uniref:DUF4012 domain-containing protein n=1 Tax=Aeromicrobium sp. TaxID=1871063 RepID=UPI003D6AE933